MQRLFGEAAGWHEKCAEKDMEAKSVQVQRLQQRTASTQVRHNKVNNMGRKFYAVLSQVWELRRRHEQQYEGSAMQHVRC